MEEAWRLRSNRKASVALVSLKQAPGVSEGAPKGPPNERKGRHRPDWREVSDRGPEGPPGAYEGVWGRRSLPHDGPKHIDASQYAWPIRVCACSHEGPPALPLAVSPRVGCSPHLNIRRSGRFGALVAAAPASSLWWSSPHNELLARSSTERERAIACVWGPPIRLRYSLA